MNIIGGEKGCGKYTLLQCVKYIFYDILSSMEGGGGVSIFN